MAKIIGIEGGLAPTVSSYRPPALEKAPKANPEHMTCEVCGGWHKLARRERFRESFECVHCAGVFGLSAMGLGGATNVDPETARDRLAAVGKDQWVIILRRVAVGTGSGIRVELEPGDILKPARVGAMVPEGPCSIERTRSMFTLDVQVGPVPVTLWPHEFASVSFVAVMQMRDAGELEESYVSSDDAHGHFKPKPELRAQIYAAFGAMVNAP